MRLRHVLALAVLTAVPIVESVTAAPPCTARLRPGRVVSAGSSDCNYSYRVAGYDCSARGKCPNQNDQQMDCIAKDSLVFTWTVVKTGGTGSVSPTSGTGGIFTVSVTPPVSYDVKCTVSGCGSCCALNPPLCTTPVMEAPAAAAAPESERKNECGGR